MAVFSEAAAKAHFANNPGPRGAGWNQWCQWAMDDLCGLFGRDSRNYETATAAWQASPIEGTDYRTAPAYVFHFLGLPGVPAGHVMYAMRPAGERSISTGTPAVVPEQWGHDVGVTSVADYIARKGATYRGWSRNNGVNTVFPPADSTPATTTTPVKEEEPEDMNYIIRSKNRPHAAILGGDFKRLTNSEELKIVQKLTPVTILDKLNDREYDVLRAIATRGSGVTKSEVEAVVEKLAENGVTVTAELDLDAIADAVNDEAAARLKG